MDVVSETRATFTSPVADSHFRSIFQLKMQYKTFKISIANRITRVILRSEHQPKDKHGIWCALQDGYPDQIFCSLILLLVISASFRLQIF